MAVFFGPFWLSAFCAAYAPTAVGYQDLVGLLTRQSGNSRVREHLIASPFGTIHSATFNFSRPIGTAMPEPLGAQSVNFDPRSLDVKVWSAAEPPMMRPALHVEYPAVNRRLKGDRMMPPPTAPAASEPQSLPPLQPVTAPASQPANRPMPLTAPHPKSAGETDPRLFVAEPDGTDAFGSVPVTEGRDVEAAHVAASFVAPSERADVGRAGTDDDAAVVDKPPEVATAGEEKSSASSFASLLFIDEEPAERDTLLFFGVGNTADAGGKLEQWAPGAEPIIVAPASLDPDIKLSALQGGVANADGGGETLAGKGDVSRVITPAERLGLSRKSRAKAEKCLADAVYFEARGEPLKGQEAVAQVVMNRVFTGFYPDNVCGVVYQNADRHLACQFTFACEGKDLSRIDEPDMWEQAKRIAKDTLDGKIWLADVGHATHYHAYWVHPSWVHEMKKMYSLGVHTFYRPRAWLDGAADVPAWTLPPAFNPDGTPAQPPDAAKEPAGAKGPEAATKGRQAAVAPDSAVKKSHS